MRTRRATALFVLIAAAACQKHSGPAANPDQLARPLFWSIEKAGKTSYALGTFHTGIDAKAQLPATVWDKLDHSRAFAMETDLSDPALAQQLTQRGDGKTLHDELGDAYWHKLEAALTPEIAQRLNATKPTIAATMLSLRGLPSTLPMDGTLLAHAQNHKLQIAYLEPAQVQIDALVRWLDARALEEMLDDLSWGEHLQKEMLAAYKAGDDAKILELSAAERTEWAKFGRPDAEYDEMMEQMLFRRNASWIDGIERLHSDGGAFIAVGAMHLIGPRSVLALLEKRGYKVTRLTP
jgi:uncharacterized protein YbaP (TraB family)